MDTAADLERLADLRDRGLLTEAEYEAARRRALAQQPTAALPLGGALGGAVAPGEESWGDERGAGAPAPPGSPAAPASPGPWSPPAWQQAAPLPPAPLGPADAAAGPRAPGSGRPGLLVAAAALIAFGLLALLGGFLWWQRSSAGQLLAEADAALLAGRYEEAVSRYAAARARWSGVAIRPERLAFAEGGAAAARGEAALAAEKPGEAVAELERAVARYEAAEAGYRDAGAMAEPEWAVLADRRTAARASLAYARGLVALAAGDAAAAIGHLNEAVAIQDRPEIRAALGRAKARQAYDEGLRLLGAGDWAAAIAQLRQAVALDNLPEYGAALDQATRQLASQAQGALDSGLAALGRGDLGTAVDLLAGIPDAAADAFAAAQGPLAEARRRLAEALGGPTAVPSPAPAGTGEDMTATYALYYLPASGACQAAVEQAAGGPVEWTDGLLGRKFPGFLPQAKAPGVLTLEGEALRVRGPDGAWRDRAYHCDFDTATGRVLGAGLR